MYFNTKSCIRQQDWHPRSLLWNGIFVIWVTLDLKSNSEWSPFSYLNVGIIFCLFVYFRRVQLYGKINSWCNGLAEKFLYLESFFLACVLDIYVCMYQSLIQHKYHILCWTDVFTLNRLKGSIALSRILFWGHHIKGVCQSKYNKLEVNGLCDHQKVKTF